MENFEIVAKTLFGFEEILAEELKSIGATDITLLKRAVKYKGNLATLYKSNLYLRTAIKVLRPIKTFNIRTQEDLYTNVKRIPWNQYFSVDETFAIDGVVSGEIFTHSKFVALRTKDAIADQFREEIGTRPNVDTNDPDLRINVHILNNTCTISLDSSGTSLGKRGYKEEQVEAPLSEVLAAGMIILSGWDKKSNFIDPMCGSGTIVIEAALMAQNIAAGSFRDFAFQKWRDYDYQLWKEILQEAKMERIPSSAKIIAYDIAPEAVHVTKGNAERAGVLDNISVTKSDFLETKHDGEQATIVVNPPYGDRLMEEDDIIPLYQEMGTQLKHVYNGCDAWIISGNLRAIKFIGLKPSRKIELYNGPIQCKFHKFELYRGSKRGK